MRRFSLIVFSAFVSLASFTAGLPAGAAAEFRAAASKVEITPADLVTLWGYSDRSGPATRHARSALCQDSAL